MVDSRLQTRTQDNLQVDALSDCEWRICDSRITGDDAFSLIGFIEKAGDIYEVMEFTDPIEFSFFTSLEDAVSHFVKTK